MTLYLFSYHPETGYGLSTSVAEVDDNIGPEDISLSGVYVLSSLPENFESSSYKVDLTTLGEDGLPLYIIERLTGYAFDHDGERVSEMDVAAETPAQYEDVTNYIETLGIVLGDRVTEYISETTNFSMDDEEMEAYENEVREHLTRIRKGDHVLVNLSFNSGETGWPLDTETGLYTRTITQESISESTVLCVVGINRSVLKSDIQWETSDGRIVFTTNVRPIGNLLINAYLFETEDEWSAKGVIEAWPESLHSIRFKQSVQNNAGSAWPVSLSASGQDGDTMLVSTSANFGNGELIFATPEYIGLQSGTPRIIIPQIYVDEGAESKVLMYRITNLASVPVVVTEVALRLCYLGAVSGIVEDVTDTAGT